MQFFFVFVCLVALASSHPHNKKRAHEKRRKTLNAPERDPLQLKRSDDTTSDYGFKRSDDTTSDYGFKRSDDTTSDYGFKRSDDTTSDYGFKRSDDTTSDYGFKRSDDTTSDYGLERRENAELETKGKEMNRKEDADRQEIVELLRKFLENHK
ncbi:uncharacterized protein LOC132547234 isoform X1 [Ylistrum balloti]|uniref:uncharacterized protein LOC132547234 isoform X1 n=1 Tax=Ylistrum balloti TaxID=509963 RepID=UPI002905F543|nr:uncharacterized protein LOC132547234 isoform X1 [Ylistrum balloti]